MLKSSYPRWPARPPDWLSGRIADLLFAAALCALSVLPSGCKKRRDLRDDEALKVVVAADRKLAKQEESLLVRRGALRRERVRLRDKRTSLITQKLALVDADPTKRQAIEAEESKLIKIESKLAKQEVDLNQKLATVLQRKSGLVNKAQKSKAVEQLLMSRREHSVAIREKDIGSRESDLARREKVLATRERSLAIRQAKLCPGRVTTVIQTVAAAPRRRRSSERDYSRKDVEPVYRSALKAMRRKGILVADLPPGIDRLVTEIRHSVSKKKFTKAKYAADQLLSAVRRMRINRAFIGTKIGRLSRSIKRRPPSGAKKLRVQKLFQRATSDYGDGRFRAANKKLNRIYSLLR